MKALIAAFQFLTRLPMPRVDIDEAQFAASMRWFPLVGLVIGAIVSGAAWIGGWRDPWLGALAALIAWVLVTGALHLDGLSDLADAAGAAHKGRERLLAVLADPHVGSFGAVAIGLQLVAKLILLHGLVERGALLALLLIPFAARIGPLGWTVWIPPLHGGLAARFRDAIRPVHVTLWTLALIPAVWFVPSLALAPVLIAAWGVWLRDRIGGISGDGHGAGIELVESGLLAAVLLAGH